MNKRRLFMLIGFVAFALIVLVNFGRFDDFVGYLRQARWYVLIFIIVMQMVGYYCAARFYQSFSAMLGPVERLGKLFKMALAINFVNQAFPSGGVSAVPYINSQLKHLPSGKVTLMHFVRYIFTYISFTAILLLGFLILMLTGNVSALASRVTLLVVSSIILGSLAIFTIMSSESWLNGATSWIAAVVNQLGRAVLRRSNDIIVKARRERFITEFHEGYELLKTQKLQAIKPLLFTLGTNITEIATVYVVFISFGQWPNPGVVIAAYTLANLISVVGIVTGGVGLFEATMIATFAALGIPVALATAVVIVYRVLNFALFLPVGFYFYNRSLAK